MEYLDYEVRDVLKALDNHDKDRIVKIKLADGSVKQIGGLEFRSSSIGGDDIIYVTEVDPLYVKYGEQVLELVKHLYNVAKTCTNAINSNILDDTEWAIDAIINVAKECDYWLKELKIEHDFDPLTGPDEEIFDKIELLEKWVRSH